MVLFVLLPLRVAAAITERGKKKNIFTYVVQHDFLMQVVPDNERTV